MDICNFVSLQLLKYFYFFSAYETLSDANRRKEYDTLGHNAFTNGKGQRASGSPLSIHLTSILMTYLRTLIFLVKNKILGPRSILKITSRHAKMVPVDKGTISRSFLLEVVCLMTCLKIWRKCFLLVVLTPPTIDIQYRLKIDSMDLASTVGLSLNEEEIWLLHTLTVQDSSWLFFCSH